MGDGHYALADSEGRGRQNSDPFDELWPLGRGEGRRVSLGLQPADDLLGRPVRNPEICRRWFYRFSEGQDARLSLFRRRLWSRGIAALPIHVEASRLRSQAL